MTSVAERLRQKKAAKKLPGLAPIEKAKQHRVGGRFAKDEDPRKTALTARCRQLGNDGSRKDQEDAANPMLSHPMGYVIQSECKKDHAAILWDVWQRYSMAERTYRMLYLGTTGDPQGAAIAMVPDKMQTDQSFNVDLRTREERERQAVASWMRWQGYLGQMGAVAASTLRKAERGDGKPLWDDAKPTYQGRCALTSLSVLAGIVDSR
mgnify:CR=1 FL=1